jgi:hypothetical protein
MSPPLQHAEIRDAVTTGDDDKASEAKPNNVQSTSRSNTDTTHRGGASSPTSVLSLKTPIDDDTVEEPPVLLIVFGAATEGLLVTPTNVVAATNVTKPRILVLYSSQSLDRGVVAKQRNTFAFLDAKNIHYDTLDGADPHNKETRNNLFTVSGSMQAQYPQFFSVQGDQLNFWGDWERFQASNEMGTLLEDMLGENANANANSNSNSNASCGITKSHTFITTVTENGPQQQHGGSGGTVLVLCSNQSLTREVAVNQEKALTILKFQGIAYYTLDGADPSNKDQRNELFETSGIRAKYPQFFVTDISGQTTFWGDWQRFETANEAGSLAKELLGSEPAAGNEQTTEASGGTAKGKPPLGSKTGAKGRGVESSSGKSTTSSETKQDKAAVTSGTNRSGDVKAADRSIETDITIYGATGFVAKHIMAYLMQKSVTLNQELKITLAGRNASKLQNLHSDITEKMKNLRIVSPDSTTGYCTFDTFVADSSDTEALRKMADRTRVVLSCAGPFAKCGSNVVWACAFTGADYVSRIVVSV